MAYKYDNTYGIGSLPHVGVLFNEEFGSLVRRNRFLFRVQDDNSQARHDTRGFVAGGNIPHDNALVDAAIKHLDRNTRSSPSPFISLSFSLAWVIQEAHRRQDFHHAHPNTRIAVVDGFALLHRIRARLGVSVVDVVKANGRSSKRLQQLRGFADNAQELLVLGMVPASAIIGIVPWKDVVSAFPSWFFKIQGGNNKKGSNKKKTGARKRMNSFVEARQGVADAVAVKESVDFAAVLLGTSYGRSTESLEQLAFYIYWWPLPTQRKEAPWQAEEDWRAICREVVARRYGWKNSRDFGFDYLSWELGMMRLDTSPSSPNLILGMASPRRLKPSNSRPSRKRRT